MQTLGPEASNGVMHFETAFYKPGSFGCSTVETLLQTVTKAKGSEEGDVAAH